MALSVSFVAGRHDATDVVLNWQRGSVAAHGVSSGIVPGKWTITGSRTPDRIRISFKGRTLPTLGCSSALSNNFEMVFRRSVVTAT